MIRTGRTTVGRELERLLRDGTRPPLGDARLLDRYLVDRDESAFETLVDRHGPMVLSLCRRCLRDPRDVEDAFQATFLVLVRKGAGLRDKTSLSSWLYGVAYRVAARARADVLKRRAREGESEGLMQAVARPTVQCDDTWEAIDTELSRLPEKYRAPLILCYLEGRTHEQAAAELGWPVGTVRSRMAKARALLEPRLTRRGLDASACLAFLRPGFLASSLTSTVPSSLVQATVFAASRFVGVATLAVGGAASLTSTSWPATALAQGVLAAMMISQLKWIGVGATAFGLIAATAGMSAWAVNAPARLDDNPKPVQESKPAEARPRLREVPRPATTASVPPGLERQSSEAVQARLTELERKLDRLTELLHRMEERSPVSEKILEVRGPGLEVRGPGVVRIRPNDKLADVRPPAPPSPPRVPQADAPPVAEIPPIPSEPPAPRSELPPPQEEADMTPPIAEGRPPAPPNPLRAPQADAPPVAEVLPPPIPSGRPTSELPPLQADAEITPVAEARPPDAPPSPPRAPQPNNPPVAEIPPTPIEPPVPNSNVPRLEAGSLTPPPTSRSEALPAGRGNLGPLFEFVLSRREHSSVREIEALIQNLYRRQQRNDQLRSQGVISEADAIVPTELARILVAQLREMEDEFESDEHDLKRLVDSSQEANEAMEKTKRLSYEPIEGRAKAELEDRINRESEVVNELNKELRAKKREFEVKSTRLDKVRRLIEWAESHFKELKL
jgi:RNA polymerase sigma factor (sigma-70 family)